MILKIWGMFIVILVILYAVICFSILRKTDPNSELNGVGEFDDCTSLETTYGKTNFATNTETNIDQIQNPIVEQEPVEEKKHLSGDEIIDYLKSEEIKSMPMINAMTIYDNLSIDRSYAKPIKFELTKQNEKCTKGYLAEYTDVHKTVYGVNLMVYDGKIENYKGKILSCMLFADAKKFQSRSEGLFCIIEMCAIIKSLGIDGKWGGTMTVSNLQSTAQSLSFKTDGATSGKILTDIGDIMIVSKNMGLLIITINKPFVEN
jgi:hypothetical protein